MFATYTCIRTYKTHVVVLGVLNTFFPVVLLHDNVRRRHEHRDSRDNSERREGNETEAIDDHGGELPIHNDFFLLVAYLHPVRDELELLEDALKFPVGRGSTGVSVAHGGSRLHRRGRGTWVRRRRRGGWRRRHRRFSVVPQWIAVHPNEATAPVAARSHGHWPES